MLFCLGRFVNAPRLVFVRDFDSDCLDYLAVGKLGFLCFLEPEPRHVQQPLSRWVVVLEQGSNAKYRKDRKATRVHNGSAKSKWTYNSLLTTEPEPERVGLDRVFR